MRYFRFNIKLIRRLKRRHVKLFIEKSNNLTLVLACVGRYRKIFTQVWTIPYLPIVQSRQGQKWNSYEKRKFDKSKIQSVPSLFLFRLLEKLRTKPYFYTDSKNHIFTTENKKTLTIVTYNFILYEPSVRKPSYAQISLANYYTPLTQSANGTSWRMLTNCIIPFNGVHMRRYTQNKFDYWSFG